MNFDKFLASVDLTRVCRVLEKLALCELHKFALTGSLAMETHRIGLGGEPKIRPLHDVDIVVESFASIPAAIAKNFLVRHIHPRAPEGKILIQLVDPDESLRIDVFRTYGATMLRSRPVCFGTILIQVVSLEDLAARAASLLMDIERGAKVHRKHAQDFKSLSLAISLERVEVAWQDHRKPADPSTFKEASTRLRTLMELRSNLLMVPEYSHDVDVICPKCEVVEPFRLSSPLTIISILGYC